MVVFITVSTIFLGAEILSFRGHDWYQNRVENEKVTRKRRASVSEKAIESGKVTRSGKATGSGKVTGSRKATGSVRVSGKGNGSERKNDRKTPGKAGYPASHG